MTATSVDQLLADARRHIDRVSPEDLGRWRAAGALLIDIRPERQRAVEGEFDYAIVVERNVLEWRFDLWGEYALPDVDGYGQPVVVACSEGYASSFAAASLRALGFTRVADLAGGYRAWRAWRETPPSQKERSKGEQRLSVA
ncbi:MAG TPA: rhodanese-like domain-containing protein [Acidimicrobiales bacterium]|nr:rhodanese-like domain-containing protein [Acidimicrobiales bacterium]